MKQRTSPELKKLAHNIGEFIRYWGFKNVHGEIWTLLFLHPHPHSITEISQALNISKGLASISIKELLKYRVILPVRASDTKWLRYQANPNYWESIQMVLQNREKKMLQDIGESFARLRATAKGGTSDRTTMQRHIELERMIKTAQKLLNVLLHIRRWELLASLRWGRTSG